MLCKLFRFWIWADNNTVSGNDIDTTFEFLDLQTRCSGFASALREVGWLSGAEGCLNILNFSRHNGQSAKDRAATNRRVAECRKRKQSALLEQADKNASPCKSNRNADNWIKLEHTTPDKTEMGELAEILGLDCEMVVGKVALFWMWADANCTSGELRVSRAFLDKLMMCPGFAMALIQVGWLSGHDGCLAIPNFIRHNRKSAKSRAAQLRKTAENHNQSHKAPLSPSVQKSSSYKEQRLETTSGNAKETLNGHHPQNEAEIESRNEQCNKSVATGIVTSLGTKTLQKLPEPLQNASNDDNESATNPEHSDHEIRQAGEKIISLIHCQGESCTIDPEENDTPNVSSSLPQSLAESLHALLPKPLPVEEKEKEISVERAARARARPLASVGLETAELPDVEAVKAYAHQIGLGEWRAVDWFHEMEGCGWLDHFSRPIRSWQAVLRRVQVKWQADGMPSGPRPANPPRPEKLAAKPKRTNSVAAMFKVTPLE